MKSSFFHVSTANVQRDITALLKINYERLVNASPSESKIVAKRTDDCYCTVALLHAEHSKPEFHADSSDILIGKLPIDETV